MVDHYKPSQKGTLYSQRRLTPPVTERTDHFDKDTARDWRRGVERLEYGIQAGLVQVIGCRENLHQVVQIGGQDAMVVVMGTELLDGRLDFLCPVPGWCFSGCGFVSLELIQHSAIMGTRPLTMTSIYRRAVGCESRSGRAASRAAIARMCRVRESAGQPPVRARLI